MEPGFSVRSRDLRKMDIAASSNAPISLAVQVERSRFDHFLVKHAPETGADVRRLERSALHTDADVASSKQAHLINRATLFAPRF
jgi:hypothetical protein